MRRKIEEYLSIHHDNTALTKKKYACLIMPYSPNLIIDLFKVLTCFLLPQLEGEEGRESPGGGRLIRGQFDAEDLYR